MREEGFGRTLYNNVPSNMMSLSAFSTRSLIYPYPPCLPLLFLFLLLLTSSLYIHLVCIEGGRKLSSVPFKNNFIPFVTTMYQHYHDRSPVYVQPILLDLDTMCAVEVLV